MKERNGISLQLVEKVDELPPLFSERYSPVVHTKNSDLSVSIPLFANGKPLGLIAADQSESKRPVTRKKRRFLEVLANPVVLAIENAKLHDNLKSLAIRDSLTGLFNRRGFDAQLQREVERAERCNHPLSLVMTDLDHWTVIGRALALGKEELITVDDIPEEIRKASRVSRKYFSAIPTLRESEITLIKRALEECKGNKSRAARVLGIDRKTFYRKMNKYGLETTVRA